MRTSVINHFKLVRVFEFEYLDISAVLCAQLILK